MKELRDQRYGLLINDSVALEFSLNWSDTQNQTQKMGRDFGLGVIHQGSRHGVDRLCEVFFFPFQSQLSGFGVH